MSKASDTVSTKDFYYEQLCKNYMSLSSTKIKLILEKYELVSALEGICGKVSETLYVKSNSLAFAFMLKSRKRRGRNKANWNDDFGVQV